MHGGAYMRGGGGGGGLIHGVRQVARKRRAPICRDGGGGLIGRKIQYAAQSHFNTYNFQIQWIIL